MADTFSITSQRPSTQLLTDGRAIDIMEIGIATKPSSIPLILRVPLAQYTAEQVAQLADAAAKHAEEIHAL